VPTFHPAAALRGGRWGGVSPVDAIREDLGIVRQVLEESRPQEPVAVEVPATPRPTEEPRLTPVPVGAPPDGVGPSDDGEQLGLF